MLSIHSHAALTLLLATECPYPPEVRDQLLHLAQQQIIRCTFTAFDPAVSAVSLSPDESDLLYPALQCVGAKGLPLLPHLLTYGQARRNGAKPYLRPVFNAGCFAIDGAMVMISSDAVPLDALDACATSELIIIAHWFAQSPNGIWCLERGDLHPLVLGVAPLKVWTLAGIAHQPDFYVMHGVADPAHGTAVRGIDLFTSAAAAQRCANQCVEPGVPALMPLALSGRDLLECLARADVASINDAADFAITPAGVAALGSAGVATTAALLAALA